MSELESFSSKIEIINDNNIYCAYTYIINNDKYKLILYYSSSSSLVCSPFSYQWLSGRHRDWQSAVALLQQLRQVQLQPSTVTHNALGNACRCQWPMTLQICGRNLEPDLISCDLVSSTSGREVALVTGSPVNMI